MLLGIDDLKGRDEPGDLDHLLPDLVGARDREDHVFGHEELRGDLVEMQLAHLLHLLRELPEHGGVVVPRPGDVLLALLDGVALAAVVRHREALAKNLMELLLAYGRGPCLQSPVQREQGVVVHLVEVVLSEPQTRCLLDGLLPQLVPQDGHADQFLRNEPALVDQDRVVLPHLVEDVLGRALPPLRGGLGGYGEGVDEGLGVGLADLAEEVVHKPAVRCVRRLYPPNQLRDHVEPDVNTEALEAVDEGPPHCRPRPVLEPEPEQPQEVLQALALSLELDRCEEALDGRDYPLVGQVRALVLVVVRDHLVVHQSPRVPRLLVAGVAVGRVLIAVDHALDGLRVGPPAITARGRGRRTAPAVAVGEIVHLPLPALEVAPALELADLVLPLKAHVNVDVHAPPGDGRGRPLSAAAMTRALRPFGGPARLPLALSAFIPPTRNRREPLLLDCQALAGEERGAEKLRQPAEGLKLVARAPEVLEARHRHLRVLGGESEPRLGREAQRVVPQQPREDSGGELEALALPAEVGVAAVGVDVVLRGYHQLPDGEDVLPDLHLLLHALKTATPGPLDAPDQLRVAVTLRLFVQDDLLELRELLDPHEDPVGARVALAEQRSKLHVQRGPRGVD
mmetsp:Transcript_15410/g.37859  ORF Transcript_15410/g.37859 Transcript_15410/m.37859 type:complete len:625 (+) Transcript_15410:1236-3110(+)